MSIYLVIYFLLAHWMACVWRAVGGPTGESQGSGTPPPPVSWVLKDGLSGKSPYFQHLRSIYYIITAFTTVGYGDIVNTNDSETVFALLLIVMSSGTFSGFVAVFDTTFREIDVHVTKHQVQMQHIKHYMQHRNLSTVLQDKISRYHTYLWGRSKGLHDGVALAGLPPRLLMELKLHIHQDIISCVNLFGSFEDKEFIKMIASALQAEVFLPKDHIVRKSTYGRQAYFISEGVVVVHGANFRMSLKKGDFFEHESLDLSRKFPELRKTDCLAATFCDIFSLRRTHFEKMYDVHPTNCQRLYWKMLSVWNNKQKTDSTPVFEQNNDMPMLKEGADGAEEGGGGVGGDGRRTRQVGGGEGGDSLANVHQRVCLRFSNLATKASVLPFLLRQRKKAKRSDIQGSEARLGTSAHSSQPLVPRSSAHSSATRSSRRSDQRQRSNSVFSLVPPLFGLSRKSSLPGITSPASAFQPEARKLYVRRYSLTGERSKSKTEISGIF